MKLKVSVIVPVYNAEKTIEKTIKAILKQNYSKRNYEIIIVDDESTDNSINTIKKFKRVKILQQKHKGPAAARNLGVKESKGNIVLFTDADCIPNKNWINNMIKPFEDKEIVGVAGTYRTLNKDNLIARFVGYEIEARHEKLKKERYIDFIGTYSAAYRKKYFLKFGGFDDKFLIASGEDPDLSFKMSKAGLKMIFQPDAFVYHKHPDNLLKFLKVKFWRGYWRVLLYKKHKTKIFRHSYTPKNLYLEIFFIILSAILLISSIFYPAMLPFARLFFLLSLPFMLPLFLKIFKKDKIVGIFSPIIIILRDLATGLGILWGYLNES